ncbi:MAG TPA: hypothetical protein VH305_00275 [Gaiella sp.]
MRFGRLALAFAALAAVALGLGRAPEARAADECRGLQVCLPVTGPWVAIRPSERGGPSVSVWQLRCPIRGYIVAGIDARVSDRSIDISFRGENGAPVSPGVTTGREVLFTAVYTGTGRRTTAFQPFVGCIPSSGGGGRALTGRTAQAAFVPARPIERRVAQKRLVSGGTVRVVQRCPAGTRLLGAEHAYAFRVAAQPGATLLDSVDVRRTIAGRTVVAQAALDASVPRRLRVELQLHALCTKVTR